MQLQEIKDNLEQIRTSKDLWHEFAYHGEDDDNYRERCALAILLRTDLRTEDEELVRFLLENEMKSASWGNTECFDYLIYLLVQFRNPENVWFFIDAKFNNFDNYFLVDHTHVFSAGYQITCDYIDQVGYPDDNPDLREYIEEAKVKTTEEDVQQLWERIARRNEQLKNKIFADELELAMLFEEPQERMLELYEQLEQDPASYLGSKVYWAQELKLYDRAIYYQEKIVEEECPVYEQERLVKLYTLAEDYQNAIAIQEKLVEQVYSESIIAKETLVKLYILVEDYQNAIALQKKVVELEQVDWIIERAQKKLVQLYALSGDFIQARIIQSNLVNRQTNRSDQVDCLFELTQLYLSSQDYRNAYLHASRWHRIALRFHSWRSYNTSSKLVEQWLQISKGLAGQREMALAKKSLQAGEELFFLLRYKENRLYQFLAECSDKLGLAKRRDHYRRMIEN